MAITDAGSYLNGTTSQAVKATTGVVMGIIANSHTSGTVRLNDGASGTTSAGVKATGVLTASDVFTDGETVTAGDKVYTFVDALSGAANEVLIETTPETLDNFKSAVNASAGAGTKYGLGTAANPNVTATTNTDTEQTVEAYRVGTYGNAIVTTSTAADVAWGAATLENGAEASTLIMNTYSFPSGSGALMFPNPIAFTRGLFLTVGGTIDYTVIYA